MLLCNCKKSSSVASSHAADAGVELGNSTARSLSVYKNLLDVTVDIDRMIGYWAIRAGAASELNSLSSSIIDSI